VSASRGVADGGVVDAGVGCSETSTGGLKAPARSRKVSDDDKTATVRLKAPARSTRGPRCAPHFVAVLASAAFAERAAPFIPPRRATVLPNRLRSSVALLSRVVPPRSSSKDLAPLGLPLPAVLIPRTVSARGLRIETLPPVASRGSGTLASARHRDGNTIQLCAEFLYLLAAQYGAIQIFPGNF
jgi:hypothetical protein